MKKPQPNTKNKNKKIKVQNSYPVYNLSTSAQQFVDFRSPEKNTSDIQDYRKLYETSWEARKIIQIPVFDSLRKKPKIVMNSGEGEIDETEEEKLGKISEVLDKTNFWEALTRALTLERLDGGSAILAIYSNESVPDTYRKASEKLYATPAPLLSKIKQWIVLEKALIKVDNRYLKNQKVTLHDYIVRENIEYYNVAETIIHKSRVILLRGTEAVKKDWLFSESVLKPIYDDITRAIETRTEAYWLLQRNSTLLFTYEQDEVGLEGMAGQVEANIPTRNLMEVVAGADNHNTILAPRGMDGKILSSNVAHASDMIFTTLKVLASAFDAPVTRFLGISNSGLNQSADGDLENYYNLLEKYQENIIKPIIIAACKMVGDSLFGDGWLDIKKKLNVNFGTLWNHSAKELAALKRNQASIVFDAYRNKIITLNEAREMLNSFNCFNENLKALSDSELQDLQSNGEQNNSFGQNNGQHSDPNDTMEPAVYQVDDKYEQ